MRDLHYKNLLWLCIVVAVLLLDRLSKVAATDHLQYGTPFVVLPVFNLTLAHNTGAAFSFLYGSGGWQQILFITIAAGVSIALLVWLLRLPNSSKWVPIALTLIMGGALGNLWDRLAYGYVIDFIELHIHQYSWPIFNIADSAICVGAVMLIIDSLRNNKTKVVK